MTNANNRKMIPYDMLWVGKCVCMINYISIYTYYLFICFIFITGVAVKIEPTEQFVVNASSTESTKEHYFFASVAETVMEADITIPAFLKLQQRILKCVEEAIE